MSPQIYEIPSANGPPKNPYLLKMTTQRAKNFFPRAGNENLFFCLEKAHKNGVLDLLSLVLLIFGGDIFRESKIINLQTEAFEPGGQVNKLILFV